MTVRSGPIGRQLNVSRILFLAFVLTAMTMQFVVAEDGAPTKPADALDRIAKRFDFDEQKLGNFESLPMNWLPMEGPGHPRFLEPAFDMNIGHDAAPSFRLPIRTGNVGAYYLAKDIPAHPGSEYRISAWVRTHNLDHAYAFITAYYVDYALQKIPGTERSSAPINAASRVGDWSPLVVDLPGGFENARWIALTCQVQQPVERVAEEGPFVPIPDRDALGDAWFDDILVIRRPRVEMTLDRTSHVYFQNDAIRCDVRLLDLDGAGLDVALGIDDATDRRLQTFTLDGPSLLASRRPIEISPVAPGIYTARLELRLDSQPIAAHERRFVVLRRGMTGERINGSGFGITLDGESIGPPEIVDLIDRLRPGAVKVPFWRDDITDEGIVHGDPASTALVQTLHDNNIDVVGVLADLPRSLAASYEYPRRTVERALAVPLDEKRDWVPYLGLLLMRHGAWTSTWQLGGDDESPRLESATVEAALNGLRKAVRPLVGKPRLVLPSSSLGGAAVKPSGDVVASTTFAFHRTPDITTALVDEDRAAQGGWATISLGEEARYDRDARLVQFCRGLVSSRPLGFEAVFAPAMWSYQSSDGGTVIRPREELVLFDTIARRLGGLPIATRLTLHPEVEAWLFTDAAKRDGAIAMWRPDDRTMPVTIDLLDSAVVHDAWGHDLDVSRTERGLRFEVGGMPVFVGGVIPARIEGIDSFELDNGTLVASLQTQPRELMLRNTGKDDWIGELSLQAPAGWRMEPRRLAIRLRPGETMKERVQIKPPSNAPAGWYELFGRLDTGGIGTTHLSTPMRIDAPGLDVNVFAHREDESLRFVQRVTNTSDRPLRLRAYLIAPGHPRDTRSIDHLGAGESAVREYVVSPAEDLSGEFVRLSVEEIGGELKYNTVIQFK